MILCPNAAIGFWMSADAVMGGCRRCRSSSAAATLRAAWHRQGARQSQLQQMPWTHGLPQGHLAACSATHGCEGQHNPLAAPLLVDQAAGGLAMPMAPPLLVSSLLHADTTDILGKNAAEVVSP